MTEQEKPPPKRRESGQQAAAAYRKKHDSVSENTMPMLFDLNARIDRVAERIKRTQATPIPRADPETDPRRDSQSDIDVVELPPESSASPKKE